VLGCVVIGIPLTLCAVVRIPLTVCVVVLIPLVCASVVFPPLECAFVFVFAGTRTLVLVLVLASDAWVDVDATEARTTVGSSGRSPPSRRRPSMCNCPSNTVGAGSAEATDAEEQDKEEVAGRADMMCADETPLLWPPE
jgi:hypothetical protein